MSRVLVAPPDAARGVATTAADRVGDPSGNIAGLLRSAAAATPDRPALVDADGTVVATFGELDGNVRSIAAELTTQGVRAGDRVAVLVPSGLDALAAVSGILWAGATAVVPPGGIGRLAALQAAGRLEPRAVVANQPASTLAILSSGLRRATIRRSIRWSPASRPMASSGEGGRSAGDSAPVPVDGNTAAVIAFTSGTTGAPRPITRSHRVLRGQHAALDRLRPAEHTDLDLAGLPLLVLHDIGRGVTAIAAPSAQRADGPKQIAAALHAGVTMVGGAPALGAAIVRAADGRAYPRIRAIHLGGGPVPLDLVRRLHDVAPNAQLTVVYGATEAEPIAALDGHAYAAAGAAAEPGAGTCVGPPVPHLSIRIVPLSASSADGWGRLLVCGPQVAAPSAAAEAADGWLDTGDLARVDASGQIWLLGRAANVVGGWPPAMIEEMARAAIPGVGDAAVLAAARRSGAMGVLAVEPAAGYESRHELVVRLSRLALERGWPPLDVTVLHRLPRDRRSGTKIDARRLRRQLGGWR